MDNSLAKKLVQKNLINESTEVTARYTSISISGDVNVIGTDVFSVGKLKGEQPDGTLLFQVYSTRKNEVRVIRCKDIVEIDGMEPNRFASVYNIKADGADATIGKRRGRKPKDRSNAA